MSMAMVKLYFLAFRVFMFAINNNNERTDRGKGRDFSLLPTKALDAVEQCCECAQFQTCRKYEKLAVVVHVLRNKSLISRC